MKKAIKASILALAMSISLVAEPPVTGQEQVRLMRSINTAQAWHAGKTKMFVDWETLMTSDTWQRVMSQGAATRPGKPAFNVEEATKAHEVRILLTADKKGYQVQIVPKEKTACAVYVFSDESGLITIGRNIDCEEKPIAAGK